MAGFPGTALAIALTIPAGVSCAPTRVEPTQQPTRQEARLDSDVELKAGQSVAITGETIVLTFERVTTDSRCPAGVQCVWAGDAVVRVTVTGSAKADKSTLDLHTQQSGRDGTVQGFRIRLVQLMPATQASEKIPADRYMATFLVSRIK